MDSKKPLNKSITFWIMVLFLLYSALGFFAVPYFAKDKSKEIVLKQINSILKIDNISFNPFTISTELTGISIVDKDTTLWFSADKIHINANLWDSLFNNASISKFEMDNPYYKIVTKKINGLSSLKYPRIAVPEDEKGSTLMLDIEEILVHKGSIDYDDNTGKKQLNINLNEILFKNQKFSTKDKVSNFELSFLTEKNESTNIKGTFNIVKQSFDINWKVDNWSTETLFDFIADANNQFLGFKNQSGIMKANGTMKHTGEEGLLPNIFIESFSLNDFNSLEESKIHPQISIPIFTINNAQIDLSKESLNVESVEINNSEISLNFNTDNTVTFKEDKTLLSENNPEGNNWKYAIHQTNINNTLLHLNKQTTNTLNFNHFSLSNFTNNEQQKAKIKLSVLTDDVGTIDIEGNFLLTPLSATIDIAMHNSDLSKWNDWMPEDLNLSTETGLLSLQQNLTFLNNEITTNGWIKLNNLKLLDDNKQQFLTIQQLDILENSIDSSKKSVSLNTIKIDKAEGTLSISSDQQLNLNNLIKEKEENKVIEDSQDGWIIEINQVEFIDSKTAFSDKSIKPSYHTVLSSINGKVKGLSSTNLSKADVSFKGVLDTYAKINISGQINPLSEKTYTDLSIDIKNLSLQNFNSYSAQYLGFPITRGKADFELKYKLNQSLLKGVNNLQFKQLKFGTKNQSKDAISLPLKLAVSLLTDSDGIMKLNLPVKGNLEDPEFSYGGIVFKAFFKLITGIVASPFKLLGKLIPGGADLDLSGIQFKAGTSELNAGEVDKLTAMQKIIKQRPNIILELTAVMNILEDKKAMKQIQLMVQLGIEKLPDFNNENTFKLFKNYINKTLSKDAWKLLVDNATKDDVLNQQLLLENAWNELLSVQDVEESISMLSKQRAESIQQQLIEDYLIPADKIFLKPSEQTEELYPQVKFGVGT